MPKSQQSRARERKKRDRQDWIDCSEKVYCQACGALGTQLHHGKRKHDPRIRHDKRWHYWLCMLCHDKAHRQVAWWNEWMENNPNEVQNEH